LRLFSFGGYGLALAALELVVFGAYDSYPMHFFLTMAGFFTSECRLLVALVFKVFVCMNRGTRRLANRNRLLFNAGLSRQLSVRNCHFASDACDGTAREFRVRIRHAIVFDSTCGNPTTHLPFSSQKDSFYEKIVPFLCKKIDLVASQKKKKKRRFPLQISTFTKDMKKIAVFSSRRD